MLASGDAATGVTPDVLRAYYNIGATVGQEASNSQVRQTYVMPSSDFCCRRWRSFSARLCTALDGHE